MSWEGWELGIESLSFSLPRVRQNNIFRAITEFFGQRPAAKNETLFFYLLNERLLNFSNIDQPAAKTEKNNFVAFVI